MSILAAPLSPLGPMTELGADTELTGAWTNERVDLPALQAGAPGWFSLLTVRALVSAQVMISQFVRSSPVLGSALTMQSLLRIVSPSLSLCPSPTHTLSK